MSCLSDAVIKKCDLLVALELILAYGSRPLRAHHDREAWVKQHGGQSGGKN